MPAPYEGGCQCGRIRYRITAEPYTLYVCHCRECQKQSASAFGMAMMLARDAVTVAHGATASFRRPATSGHEVTYAFCRDCGTRLFHGTTAAPDFLNVTPGTLDETRDLKPVAHFWTRSAQPWVAIPKDVLTFETQPSQLDALFAAYKAQ